MHADSLAARRGRDESLSGLDPRHRADAALLASDERYGIVPLDASKEPRFAQIRANEAFDLVVGNPPYVSETGNKVLFDRLRALPGWRHEYRGKSDYLYYFLAMAAEKVAPGGRLCVITPGGWMNAGNADWLREKLAATLRLDQLFLFGSMRLFATEDAERDVRAGAAPPLVESAILLATKAAAAPDHALRVVLLEDEQAAAVELVGDVAARVPPREDLLRMMAARASGRRGRGGGLLVHDVSQAELRSTRPWPVKHSPEDTAARVVAYLQRELDAGKLERLQQRWHVLRGIETGADEYSNRVQRRLAPEMRAELARRGRNVGDPILELPAGEERKEPWRRHPEVLARSPDPRGVLYGAVDETRYSSLICLRAGNSPPPAVLEALEPWRHVLRTRAEFARNLRRNWWEAAWPRDERVMRGPKVISLHRTDRGRFALDEIGAWQPSNKTTLVAPRERDLAVAYLCGVLNSELLDLWYARRGRIPRDVWRDYEPKPMYEMPYRHVPTPPGWTPGPELDALDPADVSDLVVGTGTPDGDATAREMIVRLVRAIAENRRQLLHLRAIAPELRRAVKNPWRTHGVDVDERGLLATLPPAQLRSVRIEPTLTLSIVTDGVLGRPHLEPGKLEFRHARRTTATVTGPADRVALLARTLPAGRLLPADLQQARTPTQLGLFEQERVRRQDEIDDLLEEGRVLVEAVERLVCALDRVPPALSERVVESAIARAGAGQADE